MGHARSLSRHAADGHKGRVFTYPKSNDEPVPFPLRDFFRQPNELPFSDRDCNAQCYIKWHCLPVKQHYEDRLTDGKSKSVCHTVAIWLEVRDSNSFRVSELQHYAESKPNKHRERDTEPITNAVPESERDKDALGIEDPIQYRHRIHDLLVISIDNTYTQPDFDEKFHRLRELDSYSLTVCEPISNAFPLWYCIANKHC